MIQNGSEITRVGHEMDNSEIVKVVTRVCQDKAVDLLRVGSEKLGLSRECCGYSEFVPGKLYTDRVCPGKAVLRVCPEKVVLRVCPSQPVHRVCPCKPVPSVCPGIAVLMVCPGKAVLRVEPGRAVLRVCPGKTY